ncbi:citrate lyase holo-[acyl-carrier protein] synthase [uncultured Cohaesibacter sp.]|uniref:citrate lyase holo-[acyl-carrier protein] synthase n=1 Tax=uncultured Cohaesibacter sp. TaxID=1002546 RepID=UPI002AAA8554|nr:citrate lyase holo-[acyl-carrier protein] synthase [uncultured Cohaesibacter sp.]
MKESCWTDGAEVALKDMLQARERRVRRREDGLAHYRMPTITFSVVMPGPVKLCPMSELLAKKAECAMREQLSAKGWESYMLWSQNADTGPEALFAVGCEAEKLKMAMVELEESHPLGRLWDLDVHGADGRAVSRRDIGMAPRQCLLCDQPAHACARSRAHEMGDIIRAMEERIRSYLEK